MPRQVRLALNARQTGPELLGGAIDRNDDIDRLRPRGLRAAHAARPETGDATGPLYGAAEELRGRLARIGREADVPRPPIHLRARRQHETPREAVTAGLT